MRRLTIAALSLMAVGLLALAACGGAAEDDDTELAPGLLGASGSGASTSVGASRLAGDYSRNETAADDKYMGKVFEVTGLVIDTGRTSSDIYYVTLNGIRNFPIQCNFASGVTGDDAQFTRSQQVTLKGTVEGYLPSDVAEEGQRGIFMLTTNRVTLSDCIPLE